MRTIVVTDGKYRSSIAAVRVLGRAGYDVVITQTRGDISCEPPVFSSCFATETRWIDGSVKDADYTGRLLKLLSEYDRPALLCIGAATLNAVARAKERFSELSDFLVSSPEILDQLNDKELVSKRCKELGIAVPKAFTGEPDSYPVIIKPRCGEKFGLKAAERYAIANNKDEFTKQLERIKVYDSAPIIQEKINGSGMGVSLLLDNNSHLISAICHKRIREYPLSGGPSTCCESFYDAELIDRAYRLLSSFGFTGMAMVEFKGDYVLEVNPRVWGSFPMTECSQSPFTLRYMEACCGQNPEYKPQDYKLGIKMRFILNDTASMLSALCHGKLKIFCEGFLDIFRAKEALSAKDDPAPMRSYLRNTLLRRL